MINQIIFQLNEEISHNITFARESLQHTNKQLKSLTSTNLDNSPFLQPFLKSKRKFGDIEVVKKIVRFRVLPAFKGLHDFLENSYFHFLRPLPGVLSNHKGKEFYQ